MEFDKLVAVSGLPGIYKMAANRNNGLIIEEIDTGKKKFAPSRKHQFTPLGSIGIYTHDDSTELKVILRTMQEQLESNPPVAVNAPAGEIKDYFVKILPNYDTDRVFMSDIKKVIKWFNFLNERSLIPSEEDDKKAEEEAAALAAKEEEQEKA